MPRYTDFYTAPGATGEVAGSLAAEPLPDVPCKMANIKALASNSAAVYIGLDGVTVPDGSDSVTAGWPLSPGDETGWLPLANLSQLSRICEDAGDSLSYIAWS